MSLQSYQQLQSESQENAALLGNRLPNMTLADITIDAKQLTTTETLAAIKAFDAQQGWIMYRDSVQITTEAPTRTDVIQGEWVNNGNTRKVKLLGTNCYQVIYFLQDNNDKTTAFTDQQVVLRNNLKGQYNTITYRLWWQLAEQGEQQEGRWLPLTQQFIGFNQDKEQH